MRLAYPKAQIKDAPRVDLAGGHLNLTSHVVGRARLREYVTTETETITRPVRRERVEFETQPIEGADPGTAQAAEPPTFSDEVSEMVLYEERLVVQTVVVPVERVRLRKAVDTRQQEVRGDVRIENVELSAQGASEPDSPT